MVERSHGVACVDRSVVNSTEVVCVGGIDGRFELLDATVVLGECTVDELLLGVLIIVLCDGTLFSAVVPLKSGKLV